MGRLFLPGQVVSAENQGTFSDYHDRDDSGESSIAPAFGEVWFYTSTAGLFYDYVRSYEGGNYTVCSRLSKN